MICIIYNKTTKHIMAVRQDNSSPQPAPLSTHLSYFLDDHQVSAEDFAIVEVFNKKITEINPIKHMWNEATQQIEEDPNYVKPPEPEPFIPPEVAQFMNQSNQGA